MRIREIALPGGAGTVRLSGEHEAIVGIVEEGARVLDLGCGEGDLLKSLVVLKRVDPAGVDLSDDCIQACVAKGLTNLHHGDLDEGLKDYGDKSFDYVILTSTIQALHKPMLLVREMARVGRKCIVSFPNFAHWRVRAGLGFRGRMPKTQAIPFEWYESPNIHHTTLKDFRRFCDAAGMRILREIALWESPRGGIWRVRVLANLFAEVAVFVLEDGR